jgi:hypothetical protein
MLPEDFPEIGVGEMSNRMILKNLNMIFAQTK